MRTTRVSSRNFPNILLEEFKDIREFVQLSDERTENDWSEHNDPSTSDREWLLHGWDKARKEIDAQLSKIDRVTTAPRKMQEKIYSYNGYYPSVSRAVRGNPRCMGKYKNSIKSTKIVEVIWDPGASAGEKAETVMRQGIKLLAKIKSLEIAGYRVRLTVQGFKGREGYDDAYFCRITIKEENQPLDLSRISYPLANVDMLRTWVFHWYEHLPNAKYISGYGVSLYRWDSTRRKEILDAVNVKPNQYYVNLWTDIENTFKPLLKGEN